MSTTPRPIAAGDLLTARSAVDYDTVYTVRVTRRTPKTVTVDGGQMSRPSRCKIHTTTDGREYILAFGSYSMAPAFFARDEARR